MSKVQKKKRVARVNSDAVRDGISNGCLDFLSNIIENMDNNFPTTVQSNTSKLDPEHKDAKESPSNSKEYTQNTSKISSKRFGVSRKCPLMEKTKKTLKHIKHNRSIPKQRAHLATLPEPPLSKRNNPRNYVMNSTQNESRNKHTRKNKKNRSVSRSENSAGMTIKDKNIPQNKESSNFNNFYESEENSQQTITAGCSKTSKVSCKKSIDKSDVEKRYNYIGICSENDNLSTSMDVVDDSNGDTADDEYEKFIKENKKLLKKKSKTKKSMKPDRKARKNTVLHKIPKLCNSDSSDDTVYHKTSSLKISKNKTKTSKIMVRRKISNLNDSDSSDDTLYHKTQVSKDCEIEAQGSESATDPVNLETCIGDTSESDMADFTEQLQDLTDSEFVEQNKNCLTAESQLLSVTNDLPEQNNLSDNSLICDTAVSYNCKSMSHDFKMLSSSKEEDDNVINTAQTDHEDSDIEIIDIVVAPKTKSKKVRNDGADNNRCVINDSVNTNLNKANSQSFVENKEKYKIDFITDIYNDEIESKVNILEQSTIDNLNVSEVPVSLNKNKLICRVKEDLDDDIIFECAVPGKNEKHASAASNKFVVPGERTLIKTETPKSFISNKIPSVKTENSFNLIGMSKGDSSSYSNSETFSKNEDVSCSNLANLSDKILDKLKSSEDPTKEKKKRLVEKLKEELNIYQDIIQAGTNFEASLKSFETRQAERVWNIRSQILEIMGKEQCDNLNKEQINLLYNTEKMSNAETSSKVISEDLKDVLQKTTGITRLLQDESPIHSQTIVLPSPVVDKDVKPDLSLLDDIPLISASAYEYSLLRPKSEPISVHDLPKTSTRNTFTLFGEKCNLCSKKAIAACQRCAKVFFCSNECGEKFWQDGHENECGK